MPQLKILRREISQLKIPSRRVAKFYNANFKIYVVIRTACGILRFRCCEISRAVFVAVKFYVAKFRCKFAAANSTSKIFRSGIRCCKILYCKTRAQNSDRSRLIRRKSSVYRKYRAADPFRPVRCQKYRRIADVLRAADFAERIDILHHLLERLAPLRAKCA